MTTPEQSHVTKIAIRSQWLVTVCLAVVVLVLAVALTAVVGVASNAQTVADRAVLVAEELQLELKCRAAINARVVSAQGEVISLVSLTVVLRARGADSELAVLIGQIDDAIDELRAATEAATTAVDDCAREKPTGGT